MTKHLALISIIMIQVMKWQSLPPPNSEVGCGGLCEHPGLHRSFLFCIDFYCSDKLSFKRQFGGETTPGHRPLFGGSESRNTKHHTHSQEQSEYTDPCLPACTSLSTSYITSLYSHTVQGPAWRNNAIYNRMGLATSINHQDNPPQSSLI